jgi:lipopolysaccharide heptosyltransferase II
MKAPHRILFITLSNIGDLVMTTPLLEALHLAYPEYVIDVVADPRSSDLLRACPYIGDVIHRDKSAGVGGTLRLIMGLRERHYEIAIDLRTAFLTLFIRCGHRGQKRRGTSRGAHAVQHHFTALGPILGPLGDIPPARLWLDDPARNRAAKLLHGRINDRSLIIAPGANWPGKIWPIERYAVLVNGLEAAFEHVIVVGSAADHAAGETLRTASRLPLTNLAGATGLLEAAACMDGARAFVGNDSGLGHMAAALDVPTVTVFGPGQPARYRPWGKRAEIVVAPDADLDALEPQAVIDAVRAQLDVTTSVNGGPG